MLFQSEFRSEFLNNSSANYFFNRNDARVNFVEISKARWQISNFSCREYIVCTMYVDGNGILPNWKYKKGFGKKSFT